MIKENNKIKIYTEIIYTDHLDSFYKIRKTISCPADT